MFTSLGHGAIGGGCEKTMQCDNGEMKRKLAANHNIGLKERVFQ